MDLRAFCTGTPPSSAEPEYANIADADGTASRLVWLVQRGEYVAALREPLAAILLLDEDGASAGAAARARQYVTSAPSPAAAATAVVAVGGAALSLFAHANWAVAPAALAECPHGAPCEAALLALQAEGELAYDLLQAPGLLCAARALLVDPLEALTAAHPGGFAAPWWAARCATLHQQSLVGLRLPSLERLATRCMRSALGAIGAHASGGAAPAADSDAGVAASGGFAAGEAVLLVGLEGRSELNGVKGVVRKFDGGKGRYAVALEAGGEPMLLKPENLLPAAASGEHTSTVDAATLPPAEWRETVALARLELASVLTSSRKTKPAELELSAACGVIGLRVELAGELGKRTKHQQEEISQLVSAELARALAALGLLNEATALFEELALWDEYVLAMLTLGQKEAAEAKVRERLEVAPTPSMWCHLGELTGESEHFEKAWEASNGSYAKAKLALGSLRIKEEKWAEASEHLRQALRVKVHYAEAWYCCAICSLKLELNDQAMADLRKVVSLDPTHFQAWSSLGGLFAKAAMKREAHYAFREACKLRGDQPTLWQHASLAALDLGVFDESILYASKSIALGGAPLPQIASLIAQAVAKDIKCHDGRRARRLLSPARELLKSCCDAKPDDPTYWSAAMHVERECGSLRDQRVVLKAQVDALKAVSAWATDAPTLDAFSEALAQLVENQLDINELDEVREVKKLTKACLYEAEGKLSNSAGCESLRMLMTRLNRHDDEDD